MSEEIGGPEDFDSLKSKYQMMERQFDELRQEVAQISIRFKDHPIDPPKTGLPEIPRSLRDYFGILMACLVACTTAIYWMEGRFALSRDLEAVKIELRQDIDGVKQDLEDVRQELKQEIANAKNGLRQEIADVKDGLKQEIAGTRKAIGENRKAIADNGRALSEIKGNLNILVQHFKPNAVHK